MTDELQQFDPAELRRRAATAAEFRRDTPPSQLAVQREETETTKGWFSSRTTTTRVQTAESAGGWILLVDRAEGQAAFEGASYVHARTYVYERGRLLILTVTGEFEVGEYFVEKYAPIGANQSPGWENHELTAIHLATDDDLASFGRLNRAEYEQVEATDKSWRRELGHNWQITVPHAALELSLALKNFEEQGWYIDRLEVHY
ncbi:hypothetical protein [Kribbella sp. NPDC051718]|uniref:hypothetical protein n=1 Tax=Kribbella sp. NPDC051718 TaxID=3155168 RepID=UPI00343D78BF